VSSMRKVLILTCLLMMVLSATVVAEENRVLQIDTHGNVYANLYRNVEFPEDAKILTLQYKIRNKDLASSSWGPAVLLYWNNQDAIGLRLTTTAGKGYYRLEVGNLKRLALPDGFITPGDTWAEVKIVVDNLNFHVYLYCRNLGDQEWTLIYDDTYLGSRFFSSRPQGIVIGTGYTGSVDATPYLRNSYSFPGAYGRVYFDDIQIKADDKVIFFEGFETSMDELALNYDIASDSANPEPVFQVTQLGKEFK
jgi:hypothetical protein